ncbi:MAG: hypothetical protein LBM27_06040 [Lactobacillaceae bacterium]|jgi:hypothetical protein|nr:hypothetical protein [Lactobacillaceae bacterium]
MREIKPSDSKETRIITYQANPERLRDELAQIVTGKLVDASQKGGFLNTAEVLLTSGSVMTTPKAEFLAHMMDLPARVILENVTKVVLYKKENHGQREVEKMILGEGDNPQLTIFINDTQTPVNREVIDIQPEEIMSFFDVVVENDSQGIPLDLGWR